jgi:hypothetical protein
MLLYINKYKFIRGNVNSRNYYNHSWVPHISTR